MRVHYTTLKSGISRTREFEKKKLAAYAVNVGTKCGHDCLYCSTGAMMLRMHHSFKEAGENPFDSGYAILDPGTPERIAKDAKRIKNRGMVQLCTTVDAWAPEAQEHNLGRRCLKAILSQPDWSVRVLTKNTAVKDDFDLIQKHHHRILVGLSITATLENSGIMEILESNASSIPERVLAMVEAATRGLRTYGMLCPLLSGVANSPEQIDRLVKFSVDCRVEEIFVEPANARGPSLRLCQEALEVRGYETEAEAMSRIRKRQNWSRYVVNLLTNVQQSVRRHFDIHKLRFLLYPSALQPGDLVRIQADDAGVIWLGEK